MLGHVQISTGNDNIPIGIGVTHKHKKKMKALKKTTAQTAAPPNQVISYLTVTLIKSKKSKSLPCLMLINNVSNFFIHQEVEKIEVRKMVDISGEALIADRKTHQKKMQILKDRMAQAKKEQNELKANLGKFNTFVREKQSKAGRGLETEREAKRATNRMTDEIKRKDKLVATLEKTKVIQH